MRLGTSGYGSCCCRCGDKDYVLERGRDGNYLRNGGQRGILLCNGRY